jgi:hypothetical protein
VSDIDLDAIEQRAFDALQACDSAVVETPWTVGAIRRPLYYDIPALIAAVRERDERIAELEMHKIKSQWWDQLAEAHRRSGVIPDATAKAESWQHMPDPYEKGKK